MEVREKSVWEEGAEGEELLGQPPSWIWMWIKKGWWWFPLINNPWLSLWTHSSLLACLSVYKSSFAGQHQNTTLHPNPPSSFHIVAVACCVNVIASLDDGMERQSQRGGNEPFLWSPEQCSPLHALILSNDELQTTRWFIFRPQLHTVRVGAQLMSRSQPFSRWTACYFLSLPRTRLSTDME